MESKGNSDVSDTVKNFINNNKNQSFHGSNPARLLGIRLSKFHSNINLKMFVHLEKRGDEKNVNL